MKISEVPQDGIKTLHGEKKAVYAVDDHGLYTQTTTRGWKAEEIVLTTVIDDSEEKASEAASRGCVLNTWSPAVVPLRSRSVQSCGGSVRSAWRSWNG